MNETRTSSPALVPRAQSRRSRRGSSSGGGHAKKSRFYAIALGALALELVLAPQLFGGVFSWAIWTIAGFAAVAALAAVWAMDSDVGGIRMPLGVAVAGALLWTGIQAVPLPCGFVRSISRAAVEDATATALLLGESSPSMCTISRDPAATAEEVVKGAALFATFIAAATLAAAGFRKRVLVVVAFAIATLAFVALAHTLVGLHVIFGVYRPLYAAPHLVSPIMNENNLSALLTLGVPIMLALGMRETRNLSLRVAWIAAAAIVAGCVILTVSRGGIAALVCTLALFGFFTWSRGRKDKREKRAVFAIALVLFVGGGLGMFVASQDVVNDYAANDTQKIEMAQSGLLLALENPWIGVGRGAFSAAFVRHEGTFKRTTYPENILAQWTSEWGLPIAVVMFFSFAFAFFQVLRRSRSSLKFAALAAVVGIAIHDIFDFSLEMLGVSTVAIAVVAALVTPRYKTASASEPAELTPNTARAKLRWLGWAAVATAMFAVTFIGPRLPAASVETLNAQLTARLDGGDRRAFREILVHALHVHPSEPSFPLLAGAEAARHADRSSLRWLARAMVLAPGWASPHIEAARVLVSAGYHDQALLELREAAANDSSSPVELACWILRTEHDGSLALRSAPANANRILYLDKLASCLSAQDPSLAPIETEIARLNPDFAGPHLRRARASIAGAHPADAERELRAIVRRTPSNVDAQLMLGEALIALQRYGEAVSVLRGAERYASDPTELVRMRARAFTASGDAVQMRNAVDELRGLAGGSSHLLAAAMKLQAQLESTLGNDGRAATAYDEAYRFEPEPETLVSLAAVAERLGNRQQALRTYVRLCELVPANAAYRAERDRLQQAVSAPSFPD